MPMFDDQVDSFSAYITRFENYAKAMEWDKKEWSFQLSLVLQGEALDIYNGISSAEKNNYEFVIEELMRKYHFTESALRKQFYGVKVEDGETAYQYMSRLERIFNKWVKMSKIPATYEGVCDLMVREQFLRRCHPELEAYVRERKCVSSQEIVKSAQIYLDAHGASIGGSKNEQSVKSPTKSPKGQKVVKCSYCGRLHHTADKCFDKLRSERSGESGKSSKSERRCFVCNALDHISPQCSLRRKVSVSVKGDGANSGAGILLHIIDT